MTVVYWLLAHSWAQMFPLMTSRIHPALNTSLDTVMADVSLSEIEIRSQSAQSCDSEFESNVPTPAQIP